MGDFNFSQSFSYTGQLPYPQLSLSSSSSLNLSLGTFGIQAPNTCSVVLVAGSGLKDLQVVMDKADQLGQDMEKISYAVVLLLDKPNVILNTVRLSMSPPVVSIRS